MKLFLLIESSIGYGLVKINESEEIAIKESERTFEEFGRFSKITNWISFQPFISRELALKEMQDVSNSKCTEFLATWLKITLPKVKMGKKIKYNLGVMDANFGASITSEIKVPCRCDELTKILLRSLRKHFKIFLEKYTPFNNDDLLKASISLGHEFSRAKVAFNEKNNDNHIVHSISLLEDLHKTLNTLCQRIKEWYGWHFPELNILCNDQILFCKVVKILKDRTVITEDKIESLNELFENQEKVLEIINLSRISMGTAFSKQDLEILQRLNERCLHIAHDRNMLQIYLDMRMEKLAPNFTKIIGSNIGAKLIAQCGSLTKLAKCPASTIQILGAEKALFRALKTKSNKTPKYGIIFDSSWIQRAREKDRGRMSRVLSNKLILAARIDCFSKPGIYRSNIFGVKLKEQLEERLDYWNTGISPRTNHEVMAEAYNEILRLIDNNHK